MKRRYLFFLLLLICSSTIIDAQDLNFDAKIRNLIESGREKSDLGPYVTYRDTVIVSPLFLMPVFKHYRLVVENIPLSESRAFVKEFNRKKPFFEQKRAFQKEELKLKIEQIAYVHILRNQPSLFHYSMSNLPAETVRRIEKNEKTTVDVEKVTVNPSQYEAPKKFIPDRKYWLSSFESSLKFSENSTSDNWHSGPTKATILNIFTRNIVKYNYERDRIKWDNDLEVKLNFYNAPNDSLRRYKVSDDLMRLHTNFGVKAFKKWHYSLDAEFKTQLSRNYKENTTQIQAAFLSPYIVNLGLGMRYDHTHKYRRIDRSFVTSITLSPFAYTYMSSTRDDIDWGRHGFPKDEETGLYKNYLSKFGSTVDFNMTLKPNRDVTWKSRFKYFTSYNQVIAEFENSLDFAISRFFSTLLYLHIRYDDGVTRVNETDSFFQWNQLFSFGFNYKW